MVLPISTIDVVLKSPSCHLWAFAALQIVRRIDVAVRGVKWSDNGDLVAILSESSFYILAHDREVRARPGQPGLCLDGRLLARSSDQGLAACGS